MDGVQVSLFPGWGTVTLSDMDWSDDRDSLSSVLVSFLGLPGFLVGVSMVLVGYVKLYWESVLLKCG